ncbi:TPA: hypothetical protein SBJ50_003004 [Yersinia enterocolitica]|nr:hypothetical protein [Yersinia enterocolitica]HEF8856186.1 hypothetical protein [Yersinia enterocolitica]HEN3229308.1 hypothetical protein [Yersinia enterocolitica]HEN3381362.1 hypothetical protein [Yersinia enterocolitica]HEN3528195.1 hypothetical protein [Yersinia enterocolitica]
MSEIKELKRFIYSATVTSGSGSQSFYIDAESLEEADKRAANNESDGMYADDSEVTDLDALEYEDETTVDDFGDFPLISREQSLIAQLEAAERALIRPLPIGELIHRLEGQTYEKWFSESDVKDLRERAERAEAALSAANEKLSKPVVLLDKYVLNEKGQYILDGKCEPRIGFAVGWNAAIRAAGGKVEGNADGE